MLKLELYRYSDPPAVVFVNPDFVRSIHPIERAGHCNVRLSVGYDSYSSGDTGAAYFEDVIGTPEEVARAWIEAKRLSHKYSESITQPYWISPRKAETSSLDEERGIG